MWTLAYRKIILTAFLFLFIVGLGTFFANQVSASDEVDVYFFRGEGCPHCAKEEKFLAGLEKELSWVRVNSFEVWYNRENSLLLQKMGKEFSINVSGVPMTFVGDKVFTGYSSDNTTGDAIRQAANECHRAGCPDAAGEFIKGGDQWQISPTTEDDNGSALSGSTIFHIPFIGEVNAKSFSLPVLTIIIGAIDGFNPCAMWVLIYLIGLLLGIKHVAKRWIFGITFIAVSAAVYFLFMAAWLNFLLFIGFVIWIRMVIGGVAIGFGMYSIRKFFKNPKGTCDIGEERQRRKTFKKLEHIAKKESILLALSGIIILAFVVNLVELMCSAGFPAVYTHVLTLANLSTLQYYLYILFYIVIFMFDDIIVFSIAMITLKAVGLDGKYSRFSNIVGGVIILILGILLLLKPQLLMFG